MSDLEVFRFCFYCAYATKGRCRSSGASPSIVCANSTYGVCDKFSKPPVWKKLRNVRRPILRSRGPANATR